MGGAAGAKPARFLELNRQLNGDPDEKEIGREADALRDALVRFVIQSALENPSYRGFAGELENALRSLPAHHTQLAARLGEQIDRSHAEIRQETAAIRNELAQLGNAVQKLAKTRALQVVQPGAPTRRPVTNQDRLYRHAIWGLAGVLLLASLGLNLWFAWGGKPENSPTQPAAVETATLAQPSTASAAPAQTDQPLDTQPTPQVSDPAWATLWKEATSLNVSTCSTGPAGAAVYQVTLLECVCPGIRTANSCKINEIPTSEKSVATLQAVLSAFDNSRYSLSIDGKIGRRTIEALDAMVSRCWKKSSDVAGAASRLRSGWEATSTSQPAPVDMRGLVHNVLLNIEKHYSGCLNPPIDEALLP